MFCSALVNDRRLSHTICSLWYHRYYYNTKTGNTQWDHPMDETFRNMVALALAGEEENAENGEDEGVEGSHSDEPQQKQGEFDFQAQVQALEAKTQAMSVNPTTSSALQRPKSVRFDGVDDRDNVSEGKHPTPSNIRL
eukprot:7051969-Pyramimonas_sp.AAC.1